MSFRDDLLNGAARIVNPKVDKLGRAAGLDMFGRIIKRTAVDTSRARSNWHVTIGEPDFSHSKLADHARTSQLRAQTTLRAFKFSQGESLWIANGVPYIEELEHGHSAQHPEGMVRVTMIEMKPVVDQIAGRLRRG